MKRRVIVDEHEISFFVIMLEEKPIIKRQLPDSLLQFVSRHLRLSCFDLVILRLRRIGMIGLQPLLAPSQRVASRPRAFHDERIRVMVIVAAEVGGFATQHSVLIREPQLFHLIRFASVERQRGCAAVDKRRRAILLNRRIFPAIEDEFSRHKVLVIVEILMDFHVSRRIDEIEVNRQSLKAVDVTRVTVVGFDFVQVTELPSHHSVARSLGVEIGESSFVFDLLETAQNDGAEFLDEMSEGVFVDAIDVEIVIVASDDHSASRVPVDHLDGEFGFQINGFRTGSFRDHDVTPRPSVENDGDAARREFVLRTLELC